MFIATRQN